MKVNATEVKSRFDHYLDIVSKGETVIVEHAGKKTAAIIDYGEYNHLKNLDETLLIEKIKLAEKNSYLSNKESEQFLKGIRRRFANEPCDL